MRGHLRKTLVTCVVGALICLLGLADRASGQFRFNPLDEPQVTTEEINHYEKMLSLTEDQLLFAEGLHQAYMVEYNEMREEFREVMDGAREEFRETRDRQVWRDLQEVAQVYGERREELDERFLDDFKLVLTPEQMAEWGRVERFRRRFYTLGNGGLVSGETVDLTRIVQDLTLTDEQRESLAPIVERYQETLDRALIERNELYETGQRDAMELWQRGDFEEMERRFDEARKAATRLRDVNQQFARQMESALGQDDGARFEREFLERSFPEIYRDTAGMRALDMAMVMEDLSEDQARQVADIQSTFMRRVEEANQRLRDLTEESEQNRSMRQMFGMGRDRGNDQLRNAREAREMIDRDVIDRLKTVLTEEQYSQLPGQERRDWRDVLDEDEDRVQRGDGPFRNPERPNRRGRGGGDRASRGGGG